MKNWIRGIFIFFILIGISLNDADATEAKWVKDALGRSVQIPHEVRRMIATGPGALRLVIFLEGFEKVVGVEQAEREWSPIGRPYRMAYPKLSELPIIGLGGPDANPNPEAILKVNPDVIIATYMTGEQADKLQYRTGKPVVVLSYGALGNFHSEELFQSLMIGGEVLNRKKRAEAIRIYIKKNIQTLQERTRDFPEERKPNVYVGALGLKGGHGIESTECEFPPFLAVHARNVMKNCKGHRFVDKEFLLSVDPEVLFLDLGNLHLVQQDYRKQAIFYKSLKAFRTGEVYGIFPFNYYATNVETAMVNSYLIGQILYPERFSDIHFEEKAREIFRFFVGHDVYDGMKERYGKAGRIDTSQW